MVLITSTVNLFSSSDKEQLVEEEDDELKEVLDLRKIAVQLLQQEQQNRCVTGSPVFWETLCSAIGCPDRLRLLLYAQPCEKILSSSVCFPDIPKYRLIIMTSLLSSPDQVSISLLSCCWSIDPLIYWSVAPRRQSLICRAESLIHRRRVTGRAHRYTSSQINYTTHKEDNIEIILKII